MHEIGLIINIAAALTFAFAGGLLARRLGVPALVGYLLAGVAIGPFTPGFVGDIDVITQLAELGVIFLMFGVGIHFSLADLWAVRRIALPGAILQIAIATGMGLALTSAWGWSLSAGLVTGIAISVASTVVLLRNLMDRGLLNTEHGKAAIGWLVMEDLAVVLMLVVLPAVVEASGNLGGAIALALVKAALFAALMLFVGRRVIPWLLARIASSGSRELFILAVVVISLGTAVGAAQIFGVSLALGAFLAGVVISENSLSYQVEADVTPFRETFAVLFFVSVGMLVNPVTLLGNLGPVLALTALIILGKYISTVLLGLILPMSARTALVVAAGLSQIGEFSFIIGKTGIRLGLLTNDQYSLVLAGALISITLNPAMFRTIAPVEARLKSYPWLWRRLDRHQRTAPTTETHLTDHVVLVGYGRVGRHIVSVLDYLHAPYLVIDRDARRLEELNQREKPTLFGDAANSSLLEHAGLTAARALVVALPDEAATAVIVATGRKLCPTLPIIVRAATQDGVMRLADMGAQDVIQPELEGGLEIVRYTLLRLDYPADEVQAYTDAVRRDHYQSDISTEDEALSLARMLSSAGRMRVTWVRLVASSPVIGQTIKEADLRARTGASIIAIQRQHTILPNPKSATRFEAGDTLGLIGDPEHIVAAEALLNAVELQTQFVDD